MTSHLLTPENAIFLIIDLQEKLLPKIFGSIYNKKVVNLMGRNKPGKRYPNLVFCEAACQRLSILEQ